MVSNYYNLSNLWQSVLCYVTSNFYFFQRICVIKNSFFMKEILDIKIFSSYSSATNYIPQPYKNNLLRPPWLILRQCEIWYKFMDNLGKLKTYGMVQELQESFRIFHNLPLLEFLFYFLNHKKLTELPFLGCFFIERFKVCCNSLIDITFPKN